MANWLSEFKKYMSDCRWCWLSYQNTVVDALDRLLSSSSGILPKEKDTALFDSSEIISTPVPLLRSTNDVVHSAFTQRCLTVQSFIHSFIHFTHLSIPLSIYPFIPSVIHLFTHPSIHPLKYPPVHSSIHLFIHSFIDPAILLSIHSLISILLISSLLLI